ncbi:HNH endonuclease signature motif containing protein [Nocardioides stalactiti]|uniref:HNH endonuclease signature motif containing protein n=1 Tax=Nocardioides stalactiti TaxID=2755356 RepID=UPI0016029882|nr:HNH endonuclease signature motif containing protein [Nocardioides stalactiti]
MDLGTASLFDLPAARVEVDGAMVSGAVTAASTGSASDVLLSGIRAVQGVIAAQEVEKVRAVAEWAALHAVDDETTAATLTERGLDTGLPVAGPGAPLISDFAVMELAAVLGRTLDSGRSYVGQVVELAWRLPRTWARVLAGEVPVWRALKVADSTRLLPSEAAAYVDRHLAPFAHGMSWAQVDRLVEEALVRFDPDAAEERRRDADETRHVDLGIDQVDINGVAHGSTALDLPDALDLENAIARRAKVRGQLGDTDSLDARRAKALGEIAREDLTLDLPVADPATGEILRTVRGRSTELVFHLSEAALHGNVEGSVARCGTTRKPITAAQVKDWLGTTTGTIIVRPVRDLAGHQPVDSYEIPDRIRAQVTTRDHHCVFPHCAKPAQACDLDHIEPHGGGGETCACNLAPLCRGHHRLKTANRARYRMLTPGTYLWTTTVGSWLVDPTGTHDLGPRRARPPER